MARKKNTENWFLDSFKIFFRSIKLYFLNFEKFLRLMAFPVLGQIIGLFLIFAVNYNILLLYLYPLVLLKQQPARHLHEIFYDYL